jgi:hypothetical protein
LGFSTDAEQVTSVDTKLLKTSAQGVDDAQRPTNLGKVQLSAVDTNVAANGSGEPAPPKSGAYVDVTQLSPVTWSATCTTVQQLHRPICGGSVGLVDNTVDVFFSQGD